MYKLNLLILLTCLTGVASGQQKYEKESRIQMSEAPRSAVEFVDSMNLDSKIKWYKEFGLNQTSYEAKTKYKGERLSIEFSYEGIFEDLEVEIKPRKIPPASFKNITAYLESECAKYKIRKVQIQYSGDESFIQRYAAIESIPDSIIIHYEIVISTKMEGSYVLFEYLFDQDGAFVQKSRIILDMTDNIEY